MLYFKLSGGISVAYVMLNGFQEPIVDHFQPFWHKDFENPRRPTDNPALERHPLTIGDMIKNLRQCTFLYPGFYTKEDAFGKYYTRLPDRCANGYKSVERKFFFSFIRYFEIVLNQRNCI